MSKPDAVFAALADATRRSMLATLTQRGTATATELARELPMSRQAVSKHLGVLAEAGLVESEPEGRAVRYRPTPAPMSEAVDWMTAIGRQWDARLAALSRSLER
ncbi:MAG: ArsR/SmtB family transcription factor [Thermoleophilaceae bacterium]